MNKTDVDKLVAGFQSFKPRAIALWGSWGMGVNDRFTHDVDIIVYVDDLPDELSRRKVFDLLSDNTLPEIKLPWPADFFPKQDEIYEIVFRKCGEMEDRIAEVQKGEIHSESEVTIFIKNTKTLFDDGWLAKQKSKLEKYPPQLLKENLNHYLLSAFRSVHYYERSRNKRNAPIEAEYELNRGVAALIRVIFALNHEYYGKDKWLETRLKRFRITPENFERKVLRIMRGRSITDYCRLLNEVYLLCKEHHPGEPKNIYEIDQKLQRVDQHIESKKK